MITNRRRVRVWFQSRPIADHVVCEELAADYEDAIRRRFPSLRVTNDLLPDLPDTEFRCDDDLGGFRWEGEYLRRSSSTKQ